VFANETNALDAVLTLGHNVNLASTLQKKGEFVAGKLLVVHDYSGKRH
jgi:hypothetical protein